LLFLVHYAKMVSFNRNEGREYSLQMVRTVTNLAEIYRKKAANYSYYLIEPHYDPRMKREQLSLQRINALYDIVNEFSSIFEGNRELTMQDQAKALKLYFEYAAEILEI
jgi:hypothetical protein